MIISRNFAENQEEKLYSTGNEELDDLLERAFCEGYELAQREFSFVNDVKAIPRHAKRAFIDRPKMAIDLVRGKQLTNDQMRLGTATAILTQKKAREKENKLFNNKVVKNIGNKTIDFIAKTTKQNPEETKSALKSEINNVRAGVASSINKMRDAYTSGKSMKLDRSKPQLLFN